MFDYEQNAKDFLLRCGATMTFERVGIVPEPFGDGDYKVMMFFIQIITPLGTMNVYFYDSLFNTEAYRSNENYHPSEYDVLSAVQKYDVGTIDDFVSEYGFEVKKWSDVKRIEKTYKLCKKEYEGLRRIFTEEQMEELREIE